MEEIGIEYCIDYSPVLIITTFVAYSLLLVIPLFCFLSGNTNYITFHPDHLHHR